MQTSSAHAIYTHCSCHRLQLASIQAAASAEGGCLWNHDQRLEVFYYSLPKAEALKGIQAILGFPKLKIGKPSDTRRLSHERCVKAICRNCLHCCKPFHTQVIWRCQGIYSLWLVLMVYQAVISSQKFSVPLLS